MKIFQQFKIYVICRRRFSFNIDFCFKVLANQTNTFDKMRNVNGFQDSLNSVLYMRKREFPECEFAHVYFSKDLYRDVNFIRDDYAAIK